MTFPSSGLSSNRFAFPSLAEFIAASPDPAHAVQTMKNLLASAGSRSLSATDSWSLEPGSSFHVSLGQRGLAVFRLPSKLPEDGLLPFRIAAAHTDSPCLKLKPRAFAFHDGLLVTQTETYGSLIKSSILDRPLRLSGEVTYEFRGKTCHALLDFPEPAGTIPQLAIHLNREVNKGFEFNEHSHLRLVSGLEVPEEHRNSPWEWLCARELALQDESLADLRSVDISGLDLHLSDFQAPLVLPGALQLINSPRIDNLAGCHSLLGAFLSSKAPAKHGQAAFFFDHEEVGSRSAYGADSVQTDRLLRRITQVFLSQPAFSEEQFQRGMAASWLISVDGAHGLHPNFPLQHDPASTPRLGSGPALKVNQSQRYAQDFELAGMVRRRAAKAGLPLQTFAIKADLACGSTVGPLLSSLSGIRALDMGIPLLAMHSARELASLADQSHITTILSMLYQEE